MSNIALFRHENYSYAGIVQYRSPGRAEMAKGQSQQLGSVITRLTLGAAMTGEAVGQQWGGRRVADESKVYLHSSHNNPREHEPNVI